MVKSYKVVIFDWDGTLMNSIARIVSSMQAAAQYANLPVPSDAKVESIIGMSLQPAVERLFGANIEPKVLAIAAEEYRQQYIHKNDTPCDMFENADDLFLALKDAGKLLAVATGKSRAGLDRVLSDTQLGHHFVTTRCADESKSKPDPEMLLQIIDELDVSVSECVFIGDTVHDMAMAQAIEMDRMGITLGVDTRDTLTKFNPVIVVDDLVDLKNVLLNGDY